jgi:hypothetical protein
LARLRKLPSACSLTQVMLLFGLHANLVALRILPGHNVEFIGLLVFVACLGYVSAYRTFANEERLLAINKELEIARRIQSSTLPQSVPTLTGLQIAARYVPMGAVAGDFYDFLCIDEKRVGILVADVTGHGVPAALIASMLKVAFSTQADHAHDPTRVLAGLNHSLCGKFEAHFVTAAYLFVDLEKSLLHYSAAAHPPLLLASGTAGQVQEIEENGLMLGVFPEAVYTSVEIRVGPGDRCLLYTDGILEAKNAAQEQFGSHAAKNFWKRNAIVLPRVSPAPCSTASPIFPATTRSARRRTTLPSWSSTFSRTRTGSLLLETLARTKCSTGGLSFVPTTQPAT